MTIQLKIHQVVQRPGGTTVIFVSTDEKGNPDRSHPIISMQLPEGYDISELSFGTFKIIDISDPA